MTLDDVDAVFADQGREDVCRYLLYEPRSRERVAEKVAEHAQALRLAADGDYLQLALELLPGQPDAGRMVGDAYFTIASVEHARGEIGWTMHPAFTRRGLAAEAAEAVLDLAFDTLGLHRADTGHYALLAQEWAARRRVD